MSKESRICSCGCERSYTPTYSNGILRSKLHPNCLLKKKIAEAKRKEKERESIKQRRAEYSVQLNRKRSTNFDLYSTAAWGWFRKYVLTYYADNNGIIQCSTSGRYFNLYDRSGKIHLGHFIKVKEATKTHYAVAFDMRNVAPQSLKDNTYLGGKPEVMRKWLVNKFGEQAIEEVEIKKHNICKPDKVWLDEIAKEYRVKFKTLLKERNIKSPWK